MTKLRHFSFLTDENIVYSLFVDSDTQALFANAINIKSREDFKDWFHFQLMNHYHEFRMIEMDEKAIGFCYSYDYRTDGTVKTVVCILPEYREKGIGAMGELLFIDELLKTYPIRKVYNHIFSYNKQSLQSNLDGGFQIEGQLKEYRYYNGEYSDLYILSIERNQFYKLHTTTIDYIRRHDKKEVVRKSENSVLW